jgi:hypothetical protein
MAFDCCAAYCGLCPATLHSRETIENLFAGEDDLDEGGHCRGTGESR